MRASSRGRPDGEQEVLDGAGRLRSLVAQRRQLLGLVLGDQRAGQLVQVAVHDLLQLVQRRG